MPFDTTLDPTSDVILGAIDYFERHGFCQGAAVRGNDVCLWAALRNAAGAGNSELLTAACWRVARANNMLDLGLPGWSDVPGRTKAEVIGALHNSL